MTLREWHQRTRRVVSRQLQRSLLIATLIIFSASPARIGQCKTPWPYLQGIKQLGLVIDNVSNDAGLCIVDKEQLKKSFVNSLNPIKIGSFVDVVYVQLKYNILSFSDGLCATDVSVSVRVYPIYVEDVDQLTGGFEVWNRSVLVSSLRQDNANRVADAAPVLAKQLIADWRLDNAN
jgi:hypothetical protein